MNSSKPSNQRVFLENAPLHLKRKSIASHVASELKKKVKKRSMPLRVGDLVKIMRGKNKGKKGKIARINVSRKQVFVEGIIRKKVDGTEKEIPLQSSNLLITELNDSDNFRISKPKRVPKKVTQIKKEKKVKVRVKKEKTTKKKSSKGRINKAKIRKKVVEKKSRKPSLKYKKKFKSKNPTEAKKQGPLKRVSEKKETKKVNKQKLKKINKVNKGRVSRNGK